MTRAAQLTIWAIAIAMLALPVQAQTCPFGFANPLQIIDNTTWVFMTQSGANGAGQASIGKFTAKYAAATSTTPAKGTLAVSQTVSYNGSVTGASALSGRYSVSADCSGGTLMIAMGGQQVQYEFIFANNFTEMFLINGETIGPSNAFNAIWGKAKVGPPTACAGTPLQAVGTSPWSYQLHPGYYWGSYPGASVGMFSGSVNAAGQGVLKGFVTRREFGGGTTAFGGQTAGRYQVNADCSGGSLTITGAGDPVQLDFLFVDTAFTQMYILNTTDVVSSPRYGGINSANPSVGEAKRY